MGTLPWLTGERSIAIPAKRRQPGKAKIEIALAKGKKLHDKRQASADRDWQRDKARLIGLSLALIMRLGLLSVISWMVTLTTPLFWIGEMSFSGRDLILIGGGLFLLFKATVELHERMEGVRHITSNKRVYAGFWVVVAQIVALDAVFSLDAVITAVGMVSELWVMMTAVTIAMIVMLIVRGGGLFSLDALAVKLRGK